MNPSRSSFVCASCARALRRTANSQPTRHFTASASTAINDSIPEDTQQLPRWKSAPKAMKMPVRLRPTPAGPEWKVNTEDEPLNKAYDKFLYDVVPNTRGRDLLDEETKWVAATHKSFDHGRQGFNDRLAYLGKRILDLQLSLALLNAPSTPRDLPPDEVFRHAALEGVENISNYMQTAILNKPRLGTLGTQYDLDKVTRWKPRQTGDALFSGQDGVVATTMCAIIGALALKRGGEVAAKTARERVLRPLGLR